MSWSYRGEHKGSTIKARFKFGAYRLFKISMALVLAIGLIPGLSYAGQVRDRMMMDASDISDAATGLEESEADEVNPDDGLLDEDDSASDGGEVQDFESEQDPVDEVGYESEDAPEASSSSSEASEDDSDEAFDEGFDAGYDSEEVIDSDDAGTELDSESSSETIDSSDTNELDSPSEEADEGTSETAESATGDSIMEASDGEDESADNGSSGGEASDGDSEGASISLDDEEDDADDSADEAVEFEQTRSRQRSKAKPPLLKSASSVPSFSVVIPDDDNPENDKTIEGSESEVGYYASAQKFEIHLTDSDFDTNRDSYSIEATNADESAVPEENKVGWTQVPETDEWVYTVTFGTVPSGDPDAESTNKLVVKGDDGHPLKWEKEGEEQTDPFTYKFVVDDTDPIVNSVELDPTKGHAANADKTVFSDSVDVTVKITEENLEQDGVSITAGDYGDAKISKYSYDPDEKQTTVTATISMGDEDVAEAQTLKVEVTDKAGRIAKNESHSITIKQWSPEISFNLESNEEPTQIDEAPFYKASVTPKVTVKDEFFGVDSEVTIIKDNDSDHPVFSDKGAGKWKETDSTSHKWTLEAEQLPGDGSADGTYKIIVTVKDASGNEATDENLNTEYEFGIDATAPAIDVRFTGTEGENGWYTTTIPIVTVTVTEPHLTDEKKAAFTFKSGDDELEADGDWEDIEDGVYEVTVPLTANGEQTFKVTGSDLLGNAVGDGDGFSESVKVDTVAPQAKIQATETSVDEGDFKKNVTISATITISEAEFDDENSAFTVTAQRIKDGEGSTVTGDAVTFDTSKFKNGEHQNEHVLDLLFGRGGAGGLDEPGTYHIEVTGSDAAGNKLEAADDKFGTCEIEVEAQEYNPFISIVEPEKPDGAEDGYYSDLPKLVFSVRDAFFEEESTSQQLNLVLKNAETDDETSIDAIKVANNWNTSSDSEFVHTYEYQVDDVESGTYVVTLSSSDATRPLCGSANSNVENGVYTFSFIYEKENPKITSLVVSTDSGDWVLGQNDTDVRYFGSNVKIAATLSAVSVQADSVALTVKDRHSVTTATWTESGAGAYSAEIDLPADGFYSVSVSAIEKSGRTLSSSDYDDPDGSGLKCAFKSETQDESPAVSWVDDGTTCVLPSFGIDTTRPKLNVAYKDERDGTSGAYYTKRTVTVTVEDANFSAGNVRIEGLPSGKYDGNAWTESKSKPGFWTYEQIVFDQDRPKSYQLHVRGTDDSGQKLEWRAKSENGRDLGSDESFNADTGRYDGDEFYIDKKAPVFQISYSNPVGTADLPSYIKPEGKALVATIKVTDTHFDIPSVKVTKYGSDYSTGTEQSVLNKEADWTKSGNTYTATYTFPTDSKYRLRVNGKDLSGRALVYASGEPVGVYGKTFVLDSTKPIIQKIDVAASGGSTVNNTENGKAYHLGKSAAVSVTFKEKNFNKGDVHLSYTLTNLDNNASVHQVAAADITWKDDFDKGVYVATFTVKDEGRYIVSADITDRVNLGAKRTFDLFGLDAGAPKLKVTASTPTRTDADGKKYYNQDVTFDISVSDANIALARIALLLNGQTLERGKDYAFTRVGNSTEYRTSITVSANREHTLKIAGTDLAGRMFEAVDGVTKGFLNQKSGEYAYPFVLDKIAPVVNVTLPDVLKDPDTDGKYYSGTAAKYVVTVTDVNFNPSLIKIDGKAASADRWTQSGETWTFEGAYDSDGTHQLRVEGTDKASNNLTGRDNFGDATSNGVYVSRSFIVDQTDPKLVVSMPEPTNGKYYNSTVKVTATITDANFDPDKISVTTSGNTEIGEWAGSGDAHEITATFAADNQSCQFSISGRDRAGHLLTSGDDGKTSVSDGRHDTIEFVVDLTAPVVKIATDKSPARSFQGADFYKAHSMKATVTVDDLNFNTAADTVNQSKDVIKLSGAATKEYNVGNWDGKKYEVKFTQNKSSEDFSDLRVTVYDLAGNSVTYGYGGSNEAKGSTVTDKGVALTGKSFMVDGTRPHIESRSKQTGNLLSNSDEGNFTSSFNDNKFLFFNQETDIDLNIVDTLGVFEWDLKGTEVDPENPVYTKETERVSQDSILTKKHVKIGLQEEGHEFDDSYVLRMQDIATNQSFWQINPTLGTVTDVTALYGSDELNNIAPQGLIKDTVAPTIEWSGVEAGRYYNAGNRPTARLDINELNFRYLYDYDAGRQIIKRTKEESSAGRAQSDPEIWSVGSARADDVNAGRYHYDIDFPTDGHYTLSAEFNDAAENPSGRADIGEFTVDTVAPTVSVSWDNNNATNGMYYAAGRTATVTVVEHNFDAGNITFQTTGSRGSWSTSGDVHTTTVVFGGDGRHTLDITGTDLAGNALSPYSSGEFVVDMTQPAITFSGVNDGEAYGQEYVMPAIVFSDEANLSSGETSFTITGTKNGEVSYPNSGSQDGSTYTVEFEDFANDPDHDDIYTINAQMTDMAGNPAEGSITFSVNRYGSNFRVMDEDAYTRNDGYLEERQEVVIEEINVSGCEAERHGVTVTSGANVTELEWHDAPESTGYSIVDRESEEEGTRGWALYEYHVAKDNFDRDGNYHVSVNSDDKALNKNTSSGFFDREKGESDAEAEVNFVLDETPPVITNVTVANDGIYDQESLTASFNVIENIGLKDVSVELDGQPVELLSDNFGNYSFNIPAETNKARNIEIEARDYTAREPARETITGVHVTTDVLELHLPWVIGGSLASIAVLGGGAYLAVRLRRGRL